MAITENTNILHGMGARLVAGVLGIIIIAFMLSKWSGEMQELAAWFGNEESTPIIQPVGEARVSEDNPALAACLEERLGHVNQMKEDGVINDHQAEAFAGRASDLCRAQNPG